MTSSYHKKLEALGYCRRWAPARQKEAYFDMAGGVCPRDCKNTCHKYLRATRCKLRLHPHARQHCRHSQCTSIFPESTGRTALQNAFCKMAIYLGCACGETNELRHGEADRMHARNSINTSSSIPIAIRKQYNKQSRQEWGWAETNWAAAKHTSSGFHSYC